MTYAILFPLFFLGAQAEAAPKAVEGEKSEPEAAPEAAEDEKSEAEAAPEAAEDEKSEPEAAAEGVEGEKSEPEAETLESEKAEINSPSDETINAGDDASDTQAQSSDAEAPPEEAPAEEESFAAVPWDEIVVDSTHESLDIGGKSYLWLRPGTPLTATVTRKPGLELEALLVRIHVTKEDQINPEELPPGKMDFVLGEKEEAVSILAPVEVEHETAEHPLLLLSYPIVVQRTLDQDISTLKLSLTREDNPHGIAVLLQQNIPPESLPTFDLDVEPENAETIDAPPETEPADDAPEAPEESAPEPAVEEPSVEQPTDELIPSKPPDEDGFTKFLTSRNLDTGIPLRFHLQLGLPGSVQPYGGLFPLAQTAGVRVLAGYGEGLLSHFQLGIGMDFEHQIARTTQNDLSVTWETADARMRFEGGAKLFVLDMGFTAFEIGLLGGVGIIFGTHAVSVNEKTTTFMLWGPTLRLGLEMGLAVGPGAVTLSLPLDQSFGISSTVKAYQPLAASMFVGYRLEL